MTEIDEAITNFYDAEPDPLIKEMVEDAIIYENEALLTTLLLNTHLVPQDEFIGSSGCQYKLTASNYFKGENQGEIKNHENIIYLYTDEERNQYELKVKNGQLYVNSKPLHILNEGKHLIFVMNVDGKIYVGIKQLYYFHHSSFLAGQDVVTAGELELTKDKIYINASSGHYNPPFHSLKNIILELVRRGVDINQIRVPSNNA